MKMKATMRTLATVTTVAVSLRAGIGVDGAERQQGDGAKGSRVYGPKR
jgi:hypothetical protein